MRQMEPSFIVSYCTADMLDATLEEAVCDAAVGVFRREPHERVDEVLPRLVLLSGMTGEESVAIAEHWEHFTGGAQPLVVHSTAQHPQQLLSAGAASTLPTHDMAVTRMLCRHMPANPGDHCTKALAPASATGSTRYCQVIRQQVARGQRRLLQL